MPKPSDENNEVVASPKHDRRQRRDFTDEYKERILRELDACSERGQVGALLRREGLYSSQISDWRKQLEQGGRERLQAKRPGPKPSKDAKDKQIEQQLKRIAKLEKELRISKALIDLQVQSARDSRDSAAEDRRHQRGRLAELVRQRDPEVPMKRACAAVGLSRASAYRHLSSSAHQPSAALRKSSSGTQRTSARRIPDAARSEILTTLDSERFIDQPPRGVYAALLSEGVFLCSWRTMYRMLAERSPVRERRKQREAKSHAIPRLVAAAPNHAWSWDISKLATYERGVFVSLYVVLDLYSRYVVAWMVAAHENSALAQQLFREAIEHYASDPGTLIVHQGRGAPMTSLGFADLLTALGVERSYSRPRVSDDNAFSEAHFRTLKYQPDYPGRFRDVAHAREWCSTFFAWYNDAHHHDSLALFTPALVFQGHVERVATRRQEALDAAYHRTPERFVNGPPAVARPPSRVLLNPADAAPPTVENVLGATAQELDALWPAAVSGMPIINPPGAAISQVDTVNAS